VFGLECHRQNLAGPGEQARTTGRHQFDAFIEGGSGERGLVPVAVRHVDGCGVAGDRDVDDSLEQVSLGAEPHVEGAVPHPSGVGDGSQRSGRVPVADEQFSRRSDDALLGLGDPSRTQSGRRGLDRCWHAMQSNCKHAV
jgi:hypothetical protein